MSISPQNPFIPQYPPSPGSPHSGSYSSTPPQSEGSLPPKKQRKQYTITKKREVWTDEEHSKFVEGLSLYHKDWRKIEQYIGTKSVVQIRSHAQKYFLKLNKNAPPQALLSTQTQQLTPIKDNVKFKRSNSCPASPQPQHGLSNSSNNLLSAFSPVKDYTDYVQLDGVDKKPHPQHSAPMSPMNSQSNPNTNFFNFPF